MDGRLFAQLHTVATSFLIQHRSPRLLTINSLTGNTFNLDTFIDLFYDHKLHLINELLLLNKE